MPLMERFKKCSYLSILDSHLILTYFVESTRRRLDPMSAALIPACESGPLDGRGF